jgi:hypothetical protein
MPNLEKSAPGGREGAQENPKKPGHGANATKQNHGAVGQAQQDHMVMNQGADDHLQGDAR